MVEKILWVLIVVVFIAVLIAVNLKCDRIDYIDGKFILTKHNNKEQLSQYEQQPTGVEVQEASELQVGQIRLYDPEHPFYDCQEWLILGVKGGCVQYVETKYIGEGKYYYVSVDLDFAEEFTTFVRWHEETVEQYHSESKKASQD